MAVNHGYKSH